MKLLKITRTNNIVIVGLCKNKFDNIYSYINFTKNHIRQRGVNLPWYTIHAPLTMRMTALNEIKKTCYDLHKMLEICGEPNKEKAFNIKNERFVDDCFETMKEY